MYNYYAMDRAEKQAPISIFIAATIVMFFLTLSAAESIGFVPYYIDGTAPSPERIALADMPETQVEAAVVGVLPERLVIPAIAMDLPILNPQTTDIKKLDEALKAGPVRYQTSALLEERGNMFIFAHSSNLAIVHNQMYRAFNRINELEVNDLITIEGGEKEYVYRVTKVRKTDASEEYIDLSPTREPKLTLSTCDNFGAKTSRWVVEADFVASYPKVS